MSQIQHYRQLSRWYNIVTGSWTTYCYIWFPPIFWCCACRKWTISVQCCSCLNSVKPCHVFEEVGFKIVDIIWINIVVPVSRSGIMFATKYIIINYQHNGDSENVLEDLPTECKETHHLYALNADVLHISSDHRQGYIPVVSSLRVREMHGELLPLPETRRLVREKARGTHFSEMQK